MATRDLAKEQSLLGSFGEQYGKMPETSEEWSTFHELVYGADVPDELKQQTADTQQESASAADVSVSSVPTAASSFSDAQTQIKGAQSVFDSLAGPNSAYTVLQEALRAKIGAQDQGIGYSELFKKAGITGYGALSQNLNARSKELRNEQAKLQNLASTLGGQYQDMYNAAATNLQVAVDLYEFEANRMSQEANQAFSKIESLKNLGLLGSLTDEEIAKLANQTGLDVNSMRDIIQSEDKGIEWQLGNDAAGNLVKYWWDPKEGVYKSEVLEYKPRSGSGAKVADDSKRIQEFKDTAAALIPRLNPTAEDYIEWPDAYDQLNAQFRGEVSSEAIDAMLGGGYDPNTGTWWGRAEYLNEYN